jgi:DNA excision repair protein ERCC-3
VWTGRANLHLNTKEEQLDLLAKVLSAGEEDAGEEVLPVTDEVSRTAKAIAKRTVGSLSALSGGAGLTYMEYSTGAGGAGGGKPRMTTKSGRNRHLLFRKHLKGAL